MGAPGYTVFCKQGHIVKSVPHHYIDNKAVVKCNKCGAKEFATVFEWGDPDYHEDINYPVPLHPAKEEWYTVDSDQIKGEVKVKVYDVSKIKDWIRRVDGDSGLF